MSDDRGATTLKRLLQSYDEEVETALREALAAPAGLERVRVLRNRVEPAVAIHDDVLAAVICPRLEVLEGGGEVAEGIRRGCGERAELLARFAAVSRHVAARDVYPVSGAEVEAVLVGLQRSFVTHVQVESASAAALLESAAEAREPEATGELAGAMARAAQRAPARVPSSGHLRRSAPGRGLARLGDRIDAWSDTHWGWADGVRKVRSPRAALVGALQRESEVSPPSIRRVLEGYDAAVDAIVGEWRGAEGTEAEAAAAHRLVAAIAIHDSVVAGVLVPLVARVPGGTDAVERWRRGCEGRAGLMRRYEALVGAASSPAAFDSCREEAHGLVDELVDAFASHEREETLNTQGLLEPIADETYRGGHSLLDDAMWPWHSEGPSVLAVQMALWSESAPTRAHPLVLRHPRSRLVRTFYHLVDHFRDRFDDTAVGRFFRPDLPSRPFSAP